MRQQRQRDTLAFRFLSVLSSCLLSLSFSLSHSRPWFPSSDCETETAAAAGVKEQKMRIMEMRCMIIISKSDCWQRMGITVNPSFAWERGCDMLLLSGHSHAKHVKSCSATASAADSLPSFCFSCSSRHRRVVITSKRQHHVRLLRVCMCPRLPSSPSCAPSSASRMQSQDGDRK